MKGMTKSIVIILIVVMVVFSSCDNTTGGGSDPGNPDGPIGPQTIDVYTAGYEENALGDRNIKVWKNDELLYSIETKNCSVKKIFVSGNDIYILAEEYDPDNIWRSKLWKNDQVLYTYVHQSGWLGLVTNIFVSGNDVYVTDYEYTTSGTRSYLVKVWKNDTVLYTLSGSTGKGTSARGIYVSNNDVYVCGSSLNDYNHDIATVWKNGNRLFTFGDNVTSGGAGSSSYAVKVLGSTVYASHRGNLDTADIYKYTGSILRPCSYYIYSQDSYFSMGNSFDVEANAPNDIYWFGGNSDIARIFKGNTEIYTFNDKAVTDLAVKNGNVYLSGCELETGVLKAKVWKNGEELYTLTDGTFDARAMSIFLAVR